jgi:hypothetical protein
LNWSNVNTQKTIKTAANLIHKLLLSAGQLNTSDNVPIIK